MSEHVILVAMSIEAPNRHAAHLALHRLLPEAGDSTPMGEVESWWVAEDDRLDRSDCDSAVFVSPTNQERARDLLIAAGLHEPGGLGWPAGSEPWLDTYDHGSCGIPGCEADMSSWKCPNDKAMCLDHCGEDDH